MFKHIRVGILGAPMRSRELLRRGLHALGYSALIFENIDELTEMGARAQRLACLVVAARIEAMPGSETSLLLRRLVGSHCMIALEGDKSQANSTILGPGAVMIGSLSQMRFPEIVRTLIDVPAVGDRVTQWPTLRCGEHTFNLLERTVEVAGKTVAPKPLALDVALECFYGRRQNLRRAWFVRMLSAGDVAAIKRQKNLLSQTVRSIATSLQLDGRHGWKLAHLSGTGYSLQEVGPAESEPEATPPAPLLDADVRFRPTDMGFNLEGVLAPAFG